MLSSRPEWLMPRVLGAGVVFMRMSFAWSHV